MRDIIAFIIIYIFIVIPIVVYLYHTSPKRWEETEDDDFEEKN